MGQSILLRIKADNAPPVVLGDIGGWTTYTPKPVDTTTRTSFAQPGSRIYLHDWANGVDATGAYLLWNGTAIIDQAGSLVDGLGVAYGTDPFNPQGAVKPYKSFGWTGPHRSGADNNTPDSSNGGANQIGAARFNAGVGRNGKPDWWLFKRGVTHDLFADLLARRRISVPSATTTSSSLSVPGGESTTYRSVVGSWGAPTLARARITGGGTGGFMTRWPELGFCPFKNTHYVSLTFDGHNRTATGSSLARGFNLSYGNYSAVDIAFEDCLFDGTTGFVWANGDAGELTFNRCLALYTHQTSAANCSFLYTSQAGNAKLTVTDRIAILNGYRLGDPESKPPVNSVFDRCDYLTGQLDCINSSITNGLEMASGSAAQIRAGLRFERNYLVTGGLTMGANGGNALANSGTLKDNVLEKWRDPTGSPANPGYGIGLCFGAHDVAMTGNLITNMGMTAAEQAASATRSGMGVGGMVPTWFHDMHNQTARNSVSGNVSILLGLKTGHFGNSDGIDDGNKAAVGDYFSNLTTGEQRWSKPGTGNLAAPSYLYTGYPAITHRATMPSVTANRFADNILVGGSVIHTYVANNGAKAPCPTLSDSNTYINGGGTLYPDLASFVASVPGAVDPSRTLKRYMQEVLGIPVTSREGAAEMAAYVKANIRKGQFDPRFLGTAIGNWVRTGVGMASV